MNRCSMCGSERIPGPTGAGWLCRHCDKGCRNCTVDPLTAKGRAGRGYDGVGPDSVADKRAGE